MKILWFVAAERDLEMIANYIESRNPTAATKVETRLRTAVEHLEMFPRAGRIGRRPSTREIVIVEYPYVIRYRVLAEQVQVLRIFHTSTRWGEG